MEGVFQPVFFFFRRVFFDACVFWRVRILRARTKKNLRFFWGIFSHPNIIEFFLSSLSCRPTAILFASQWTYLENMDTNATSIPGTTFFSHRFTYPRIREENLEKKWSSIPSCDLFSHDFQRQKINPKTREKKHNPPTCFLEIEDFLRMCRFAPVFHTLFLYLPPLSDAFSRKMNKPMLDVSPVWHLPEISNLKPLHWSSWCSAKHLRCCMLP